MSEDDDKIRDVFRKDPDSAEPPAELHEPINPGGLVYFPGISCRAWEHPGERAALTAMRKVPGFDLMLKRMASIVSERMLRFYFLGNAVRVSEKQFPKLHADWVRTCKQFDADRVPELYVTHSRAFNAGAIGWDNPFVTVHAGTLEILDDEEVRFVLAHELGHVLSGHSLYRTMMIIMAQFVLPRLMFLPAAWMLVQGVVLGLYEWSRKSELSCDRAGLLAVQDLELVQRVHMKMAGGHNNLEEMSVEAFCEQADEYETGGDLRDNILKLLMLLRTTHPFPVLRLAEITRWARSAEYRGILEGDYPRRTEDDYAGVREDMARTAESYKQRWNEREDALGRLVQDLGGLVGGRNESLWEGVKNIFRNQGFGWGGDDADVDIDPDDDGAAGATDGPDDDGPDDDGPDPKAAKGKTL